MITPAQQQIVAQFGQFLQQTGAELQQLIAQAGPGCQQMIAQNPADPMPLNNALGAVNQQAKAILRKPGDTFGQYYDRICDAGSGEPAYSYMKKAQRDYDLWAEETWARFEASTRVDQYRAMWPKVQEAMAKPLPCNRCGAPLTRATPHKAETVNCTACRSANQVVPEMVVGMYYGSMPHAFAEQASIEKYWAIQKFKAEWESYRDAEYAADRERPDEPLERLKQLEAMELDYWTTYANARTQYEGGTPEQAKELVDARMKQSFYEQMNRNDVWRAAHGMQSVSAQVSVPAHLQNVDEWGPINPHTNPNALEDDLVHDQLLNEAMSDPARYESMLKALGYRDALQRAMTHKTFQKYYMDYLTSDAGIQLMTKSAMRAMNERAKYMAAAGAASGLLDPIEGVALSVYANLQAKQASAKPEEFTKLLAEHQMDMAKWDRVSKGWIDKMSKDTTGAVATEYSKAFMGAGAGQYGAAGQAAASAMGDGVFAQGGVAGAEPMSFEKYCEISGAMAAWSKQGKDISAGLDKHFKMTAMDFSNVSMFWSQKMMADMSMFQKQSDLTARYEQQYLAMP